MLQRLHDRAPMFSLIRSSKNFRHVVLRRSEFVVQCLNNGLVFIRVNFLGWRFVEVLVTIHVVVVVYLNAFDVLINDRSFGKAPSLGSLEALNSWEVRFDTGVTVCKWAFLGISVHHLGPCRLKGSFLFQVLTWSDIGINVGFFLLVKPF